MNILKSLIASILILGFISATHAAEQCQTFSDCANLVVAAQNEAKDAMKRLDEVVKKHDSIEKRFVALEKRLGELKENDAAISASIPKTVKRGVIKTLSLRSGATPKTVGASLGITATQGFCALSQIGGRFDGAPEAIAVYIKNNLWVYDFKHGNARIYGTISCFYHPVLGN